MRTGRTVYRDLYQYWIKIFAVNFGMGVVSGLVMAYQFGTNWSYFSDFAGSVTGPLLAYEVLTAFFLEAGFLGVMLFGWHRVGPGMHFFSTVMVALGTLLSMTWILASNSWMQTPQGYAILDGRIVPTDWIAVIFNPSFPYRLAHMGVAAFLATALIVGASGAWPYLRSSTLAPRAAIDAGAARHHRHHQPVAQYCAAGHLDLGGIVAAAEPGLYAGRRLAHYSDYPRLYRMVLLCFPRQGETG